MDIINSIAPSYQNKITPEVLQKLQMLEDWDFSSVVNDMSPRLLLSEGRIFSIEQIIPIILHFSQNDPKIKEIARKIFLPWLSDQPYSQGSTNVSKEYIEQSCDTLRPLIEKIALEFKKFVAISLMEPDRTHAPPGPVDMFWHFFILHTMQYNEFCQKIWGTHKFDQMRES